MPVYIYGLVDPRPGLPQRRRIRYVGKTVQLRVRLSQHVTAVLNGIEPNKRKVRWINQVLAAGLRPDIVVLRETTPERWAIDECEVIKEIRARGGYLTNAS